MPKRKTVRLKRRGRPPIPAAQKRRNQVKLRVRDETYRRLMEEASQNGRSLSEEAEARLERSFAGDLFDEMRTTAGGAHTLVLAMIIAQAMHDAGPQAFMLAGGNPNAQGWIYHPYAFDQAARAVERVMMVMRPPGDPAPPAAAREHRNPRLTEAAMVELLRTLGDRLATSVLDAIADPAEARTEALLDFRQRVLAAMDEAQRGKK